MIELVSVVWTHDVLDVGLLYRDGMLIRSREAGCAMRWARCLVVSVTAVSAAVIGLSVVPAAEAACNVVNGTVQCGDGASPAQSPASVPVVNSYPCVDSWDWAYSCNEYSFDTGSIDYAP